VHNFYSPFRGSKSLRLFQEVNTLNGAVGLMPSALPGNSGQQIRGKWRNEQPLTKGKMFWLTYSISKWHKI